MSTEMNKLMRLLKIHDPVKLCLGGILIVPLSFVKRRSR